MCVFRDALRTRIGRGSCFEAVHVVVDGSSPDLTSIPHSSASKKPKANQWRIERMPLVDRNVLRLGTYELLYTDLPIGVPINECVELAKMYGAAGSGSFVNGVLSAVAERRNIGSPEPTSNDVPRTE
jgi:hypothetical protein